MKNGDYNIVIPPADYPGMRYRGRYAQEHIVEFWKKTGRMPFPGMYVHHKDEDKKNNSWDNLEEITPKDHCVLHGHERRSWKHGTLAGYRYCRCDECKAAKSEHSKTHHKPRTRCALSSCGSQHSALTREVVGSNPTGRTTV